MNLDVPFLGARRRLLPRLLARTPAPKKPVRAASPLPPPLSVPPPAPKARLSSSASSAWARTTPAPPRRRSSRAWAAGGTCGTLPWGDFRGCSRIRTSARTCSASSESTPRRNPRCGALRCARQSPILPLRGPWCGPWFFCAAGADPVSSPLCVRACVGCFVLFSSSETGHLLPIRPAVRVLVGTLRSPLEPRRAECDRPYPRRASRLRRGLPRGVSRGLRQRPREGASITGNTMGSASLPVFVPAATGGADSL